MSLNCEIPDSLKELVPLLLAIGLELSTHYHPPNRPNEKWALINQKGQAGRVGMTEEEARKEIIQTVTARLDCYRLSLTEYAQKSEQALGDLLTLTRLRTD